VVTAVSALPDKSCSLDVLPTQLLKAVIDTIAPFITELFNRSLLCGQVPEVYNAALDTIIVLIYLLIITCNLRMLEYI